jgi:hypothetical protein
MLLDLDFGDTRLTCLRCGWASLDSLDSRLEGDYSIPRLEVVSVVYDVDVVDEDDSTKSRNPPARSY